MKKLALCIILVLFPTIIFASTASSRKYDIYFYKWNKHYFGFNFDWKRHKAQGIAESNLNPNAKSPVGAEGVMQFMLNTWKEEKEILKFDGDITNPDLNIGAGIHYMSRLWKMWKAERTFDDRWSYALASYNGGAGNVLAAQRLCIQYDEVGMDCNSWYAIEVYAEMVNTWKCEESLTYVKRIFKIYERLKNE